VISGNTDNGLLIEGEDSAGNFAQANYIGTNAAGALRLANGDYGVLITFGASMNVVGGSAGAPGSAPGNVISGNLLDGVRIDGQGNFVQGNLIGTDASGSTAIGNSRDGVWLTGQGNVVGGASSDLRNVISGNGIYGVEIDNASGNQIGYNPTKIPSPPFIATLFPNARIKRFCGAILIPPEPFALTRLLRINTL
jgi:hypothetical protein